MPEYAFIKDCLEIGAGFSIPIQICYDLYVKWMAENRPGAKKVKDPIWFGRAMNKVHLIKSGRETIARDIRVDVYKGVREKTKERVP
jgi:hypothetical protein